MEKIDVLESKHQDKLKEFELIEEDHFTIYEECCINLILDNKIKSEYESLIRKPQIKSRAYQKVWLISISIESLTSL